MASPAAAVPTAPAALAPARRPVGAWQLVWRRYRKSGTGMLGLALVSTFILVGFLAPVLANGSGHPIACRYDGRLHAPALKELLWVLPGGRRVFAKSRPFNLVTFNFQRSFDAQRGDWALPTPFPSPFATTRETLGKPSREHWFGTDDLGRDVLARMVHGARVSMMVGFVSVGLSTVIGLLLGAVAGYFGGWIDMAVSRIIEVVICFPTLFLILAIMAWLDPSIWNVMVVLGVTSWTGIARLVRGEFLRLKTIEFSTAATALGASSGRIIFRHVLPNALTPVFVPICFAIAGAILVEAALSYLGFGVQPPDPSWGSILRDGFASILTTPHMIYPPCAAIFLAVLSYNLVGDRLRDVIDPRLRGSR